MLAHTQDRSFCLYKWLLSGEGRRGKMQHCYQFSSGWRAEGCQALQHEYRRVNSDLQTRESTGISFLRVEVHKTKKKVISVCIREKKKTQNNNPLDRSMEVKENVKLYFFFSPLGLTEYGLAPIQSPHQQHKPQFANGHLAPSPCLNIYLVAESLLVMCFCQKSVVCLIQIRLKTSLIT